MHMEGSLSLSLILVCCLANISQHVSFQQQLLMNQSGKTDAHEASGHILTCEYHVPMGGIHVPKLHVAFRCMQQNMVMYVM